MQWIQTNSNGVPRWAEDSAFFNSDVCPEPNKVCGEDDKWAVKWPVAADHPTPPVTLWAVQLRCLFCHQTPISSIGSWQQLPRKISPFVLHLGLLVKTYRVAALTYRLWQLQQQFLFWGLQWDISCTWHEGGSLAVGKMLSKAQATENAMLWALTATTLHSDGKSCVSNLGSNRWII